MRKVFLWRRALVVSLMSPVLQGCEESRYVYRRDIGPLAWSEDGKSIYFAYSDGKDVSILHASSQPGVGKVETIARVEDEVQYLQHWKGSLVVSAKSAVYEVDLETKQSKPLVVPDEVVTVGVYDADGKLVYLTAPEKDGLRRIANFDPKTLKKFTIASLYGLYEGNNAWQLSPDKRKVVFGATRIGLGTGPYNGGWWVAPTNGEAPPARTGLPGVLGWLDSEQLLSVRCAPSVSFCTGGTDGLWKETTFATYGAVIFRSPTDELLAKTELRPVAFERGEGWNTLVSVKLDGTDPQVLVSAEQLPRGPLVLSRRPV